MISKFLKFLVMAMTKELLLLLFTCSVPADSDVFAHSKQEMELFWGITVKRPSGKLDRIS